MAKFFAEKLEAAKHVLATGIVGGGDSSRMSHRRRRSDSAAAPGVDSQFFDSLAFAQMILQNPGGYGLVCYRSLLCQL